VNFFYYRKMTSIINTPTTNGADLLPVVARRKLQPLLAFYHYTCTQAKT
jgi:hypothetical protein